jgi:hypothetical protein
MAKVFYRQGLTGGGSTNLDAQVSSGIANDDFAFTVHTDGKIYAHRYNSSSAAAESSPSVIQPDDTPATGRWLMQTSPFDPTSQQIVSGVITQGNIFGGDITKTAANTLTIQPMSCLDSALAVKLYFDSAKTVTIPSVANTIYHLFIVRKVADGLCEVRAYTTEAGVASDVQVNAYRWIGFWRTNSSTTCVIGLQVGDHLFFGKSSENVLSSGITTSYATISHAAMIPVSRIASIHYGVRDASVGSGEYIIASIDGTNTAAMLGTPAASTSDTTNAAWSAGAGTQGTLIPFSDSMQFKSSTGTLDLLCHAVVVRR